MPKPALVITEGTCQAQLYSSPASALAQQPLHRLTESPCLPNTEANAVPQHALHRPLTAQSEVSQCGVRDV